LQAQTLEIQGIAQKWYTLACGGEIQQSDSFFRFIAIWIAFNALYASMYGDEEGDWNQVRSFAGDPDAVDRHRELLREDSQYRKSVSVLKERGVYDLRNRRLRRIHDKRNLTQIASCLYQVRNNLFHADKMPGNPRDEDLVEANYIVVSKLIRPYLYVTGSLDIEGSLA
jgi:hypothetical protein